MKMLRICSLLLLLVFLANGISAQTVVSDASIGQTSCTGTPSVCDYHFSATVTAGNTLVMGISNGNGLTAITSVTDQNGNSYTVVQPQHLPLFGPWTLGGAYACNLDTHVSATLLLHVTWTSGTPTGSTVRYAEISGGCVDQKGVATVSNTGTAGTNFTGGNFTTTSANEMIFSDVICDNGTPAVGSGFTLIQGSLALNGKQEQKTVTSIGTYAANWTSSANSDDAAVLTMTIKSASAAPVRHRSGVM
jgi:hypothetical protein